MTLKEYLQQRFNYNNIPKYRKYFEEWFNNLTEIQLEYYKIDIYRTVNNIKIC